MSHFELGWPTLYYSYPNIHTSISMWKLTSIMGEMNSKVVLSSSHSSGSILTWSAGGGSVGIFTYQSMWVILHVGKYTTSRSLRIEHFHPSLEISGELCVFSSCLAFTSSVQFSHKMCHRSNQTYYYSATWLDGGPFALHSSHHVGRHFSSVFYHKKSHCGCFSKLGAQGSAIALFIPLAAQTCVLCIPYFSSLVCCIPDFSSLVCCIPDFSSLVCQVMAGVTQVFITKKFHQQCWTEWEGLCAAEGVPNNPISAPQLAFFRITYLGLE